MIILGKVIKVSILQWRQLRVTYLIQILDPSDVMLAMLIGIDSSKIMSGDILRVPLISCTRDHRMLKIPSQISLICKRLFLLSFL